MKYLKGQKVLFSLYGAPKTGVVEKDQASGIVFIRRDDNRRVVWMHEESVKAVEGS